MNTIDITIDEQGKCREAGYGNFGPFGAKAIGRKVAIPDATEGGARVYTITSVGQTIHTCSGGGANFVFCRADAMRDPETGT